MLKPPRQDSTELDAPQISRLWRGHRQFCQRNGGFDSPRPLIGFHSGEPLRIPAVQEPARFAGSARFIDPEDQRSRKVSIGIELNLQPVAVSVRIIMATFARPLHEW